MIHSYLDSTIYFEIVYKNRKNIGIYVDGYGQIQVHAPRGTQLDAILSYMETRWDAIVQKTNEIKTQREKPESKVYDQGEVFLYLGKAYPIVILPNVDQKKDYVQFHADQIQVFVKEEVPESIRLALKRFFYQRCKALVESRIRNYQSNFNMKPRSIKITDDKANWGTCNSHLELTFNWKLAMAPLESIDYVVVHELCHMIHLNHDRSFWRLVGKILPDYEKRSNWLDASSWKMIL